MHEILTDGKHIFFFLGGGGVKGDRTKRVSVPNDTAENYIQYSYILVPTYMTRTQTLDRNIARRK